MSEAQNMTDHADRNVRAPFAAGGKVTAESAVRVRGCAEHADRLDSPHETPVLGGGLPVVPAPPAAVGLVRGINVRGIERRGASEEEVREAEAKAQVCREYERLRENGIGMRHAARLLGKSAAWFSGAGSVYERWKAGGVAGLLPKAEGQRAKCGDLAERIMALGWFIPAARFFNLAINRTVDSGSVPEAIRRTISLPALPIGWGHGKVASFLRYIANVEHRTSNFEPRTGKAAADDGLIPVCPVELREEILAREKMGKTLVPSSIARQIVLNKTLVRFSRNGTNEMLRSMNAAGCSRFTRVNGEYEPLRCGQRMQPDDGSINFCVTVPWRFPTDKCSRRWGVLVGRFQLLLFVDALSLGIRARSFVVRPRSSYRQEDALHLYNIFMREHGVPAEIWHEGHVWNSGRVKDCLDLLGVKRHLVHSPHNKAAVEGRFNKLWTVLSGLTGGQIGRFRGEMERENALLMSCQAGATDPRTVFPSIAVALEAIDQAIREANATPVRTSVGSWVPDELWAEQVAQTPLRKLDVETAWMFSPYCVERTINNGVNAKVPMFEEFSVPFCFASEWMPNYHGARAKCYFDPYGDRFGTVVLAEPWYGTKAGTVLGLAKQTNDIGEYARLMLGCGFGPDDSGRVIRQRQAAALRSDRRAIAGDGRGARVVEERDGISKASTLTVESGGNIEHRTPNIQPRTADFLAAPKPVSRRAEDDPSLQEFLGGD